MKKGTYKTQNEVYPKFREYLLQFKTLATARGYLSALNSPTVIEFVRDLYGVDEIYCISDPEKVDKIYTRVLKTFENTNSHSRHSASLKLYKDFLNNVK